MKMEICKNLLKKKREKKGRHLHRHRSAALVTALVSGFGLIDSRLKSGCGRPCAGGCIHRGPGDSNTKVGRRMPRSMSPADQAFRREKVEKRKHLSGPPRP